MDDGLGQGDCPTQADGSGTQGTSDSSTGTNPADDTADSTAGDATQGGSGSDSGGTLDDSGSGTGGDLWCVDEDGDGYGDPDECQTSDEPIDGSVPNGDDCDDSNANTFPGAAPNDDPEACMQDVDDDDWGDDMPPPGVDAGTDCADESALIFPGAAENEADPTLCAEDEDEDGWGDIDPPPGVDAGTDCADDNDHIFPGAAENEADPSLCAEDEDEDGWGDIDPPPGVDAGTDCADDNDHIFPGAAENEFDPSLCAEDEDEDGWGDIDPPPGVEPGTDCDDSNAEAFPGAAPNETPPDLCTIDLDDDGWGDANPGPGGAGTGPLSGSDCHDNNLDLNPDTLVLTVFTPYEADPDEIRTLEEVAPDASLSTILTMETAGGEIPDVNLISSTLNSAGEIIANDFNSSQLYTVEYTTTCSEGTGIVAPIGVPYGGPGDVVCGLEYGGDGVLYGVDTNGNLLTFDPAAGTITSTAPLTLDGAPININSCGMARDCTTDTLLIASGDDEVLYSVNTVTGEATIVRDLSGFIASTWVPTGLEYDPVTRNVWLSNGPALFSVDLDTDDPPTFAGAFGQGVSNLQYLPICVED